MLCRLREVLGCVAIDGSCSATRTMLPKALPTLSSFGWVKRRMLLGIASTIAMFISSADVFGQAEGANRQSFNLKGSLVDMQRGVIKVAAEAEKKEYFVKLPNEVEQVRYSGQAVKEWLGPGMFVRFDIQMDEKGKFVGTVKQVEVFMPDPKLPNNPENMKNNALGVHPLNVPGAENLFSDEKKSVVIKTCRVVARVGGVNKNKLMAIAGNNRVQVELDDNVAINVAVPGVDLFQAGDDVTVSGFVYPDQPGWVEAARVAVVGKQPIGQKPAKGTKTNTRTRRDKKEPAADKGDPKSDTQEPEKKDPEKKDSEAKESK